MDQGLLDEAGWKLHSDGVTVAGWKFLLCVDVAFVKPMALVCKLILNQSGMYDRYGFQQSNCSVIHEHFSSCSLSYILPISGQNMNIDVVGRPNGRAHLEGKLCSVQR